MNNKQQKNLIPKKIILAIALTSIIFCLILSLCGYLGKYNLYFELASHFKVQYLYLSIISTVCLAITSPKKWFYLGLFCIILNLAEVGHWYLPQNQNFDNIQGTNLKVLLSNIYSNNNQYHKFINLIKTEEPDIILVQEYTSNWNEQLQVIESIYPYSLKKESDDNFGMAIYSKIPLENLQIKYFSNYNIPNLITNFTIDNKSIELIGIHPLPPINNQYFQARNEQLLETAEYIKKSQTTLPLQILIGDFNTTMWSPIYRQLIQQTKLQNTRLGFGILPTWKVDSFFFAIPIDHCLVTDNIKVKKFKTGDDINSDHLPIIADLFIPN